MLRLAALCNMRLPSLLIGAFLLFSVEGKICTKRPIPFPQDLVGHVAGFSGCEKYAFFYELKITKWALVVKSSSVLGCDDEAVHVPFNKADKPVMLYYRFPTYPKNTFQCTYVTKKVFVWGRTRKEFKRLISWAARSAVYARQYRGCDYLTMKRSFTYAEVMEWLKHDRICNAALNYLTAVAYRNFFSIDPSVPLQRVAGLLVSPKPNVFC